MRVFQDIALQEGAIFPLNESATHHVARVMRAKIGDELTVFNGQGGEFTVMIAGIDKKAVTVEVKKFIDREAESELDLCLVQGISRGEKMDYTIQKAVELGVKKIVPLFSERCNVKLDQDRRDKRMAHWRSIVISACEQSGRNRIPELTEPQMFNQWIAHHSEADLKFVLAPLASRKLGELSVKNKGRIVLLIGPEGGLSDHEIQLAQAQNFLSLNLGPRILRTETAAVAAITALQCYAGDI